MCTARLFSQRSTSLHSTFIWTGPSAILGIRKPQALGYPGGLHPSVFPRFDTIPECDGRTDGQTDGYAPHSIYNVCKASFAVCCNKIYKNHLRRLRKLSHILDVVTRKRIVRVLVLTRVDYCNSALAGLSDSTLAPLQRVLHAAARFVLDLRPRDRVTAALQLLHWLPVRQRITYKLCVLMHAVAFNYAPTYLRDAVVPLSTLPGREHLRTADNTTCHGCHLGSVQERSPSPVHKLGTNSLHPFITRTVSQLLSVTSKLYYLLRRMVLTDN